MRNCEVPQFGTVMQYCVHKIVYDNFRLVQFNHQDKKEIEMISIDKTQHLYKVECFCDFSLSFCAVEKTFLSSCPHLIPIITEVFQSSPVIGDSLSVMVSSLCSYSILLLQALSHHFCFALEFIHSRTQLLMPYS